MRLFFTPLFVFERKQIAMIAEEKSPTRISHRIFATSRSEMGINMNKNKYMGTDCYPDLKSVHHDSFLRMQFHDIFQTAFLP